ncbi:MAG TPA: amidohydrolase family protein [Trebonia sp.]
MDDTLLLVNGRIWTGGPDPSPEPVSALAIGSGRILELGETETIRSGYPGVSEVDLGGRTVVPGLIDGHNHSVRAGAAWARELDLTACASREEFLAALSGAVAAAKPGQWIAAVGGWHPSLLGGWAPDRKLLNAVAPDNPVYLQAMYEFAVVNAAALTLVPDVAAGADGRVTGTPAYNAFLAAMGTLSRERQLAGLAAMYRDFASAGITGVHDPGGFGMTAPAYEPVRELWRSGGLKCRLRLYYSACQPGTEAEQIASWLRDGFGEPGDDMLRSVGIGEVVHFSCHDFEGLDEFEITDEAAAELTAITRAVAEAGLPMQIHGVLDPSITRILDCWEAVDADVPLSGLRFALAHCDRISPANVARLKRLGAGAIVDDRQAFRAAASRARWGAGSLDAVPPLGDIAASGMPFGAGTDATRASSWNPWRSLHWLVTGESCDGGSVRDARHRLSRSDALRACTHGNAWFSFEEETRGLLAPGCLADLAVLDRDYFSVDAAEIPAIRSELTLVGGSVTYSSGVLADPA